MKFSVAGYVSDFPMTLSVMSGKFSLRAVVLLVMFLSLQAVSAQDDMMTEAEDAPGTDTLYAGSAVCDSVCAWPLNVQQRIDRLLEDEMFLTSQVGLLVYDLTADSVIYGYNEKQLMRPASTMKVLTAIAAIDRLGGSYRFKTSLYYTGTVDRNVLDGDVYCVGGFDPCFNGDDMSAFVESIRRMGIDTIRGGVFADKTMKDSDKFGEGWCWDDDNPVLSPLLISRRDVFAGRFIAGLRNAGIVVGDSCSEGAVPAGAFQICVRTHTIDQILMGMMKDSDNLYAEAMLYQIAASTGARPAKVSHARDIIKRLIGKAGAGPSCKIADGSGLSLYNYVSPEIEVALLRYAYRNSNIYLHIYPSMPVAGHDGTLRRRMKGSFTEGNVHAKTRTLTGISSLAGYCTAPNGHVLCFSIINQGLMQGRAGRNFQDRVCTALCMP